MAPRLVYWDSSVFIDWLSRDLASARPDRIAKIEPVIEAAINRELLIVTSVLAIAETIRPHGACGPVDYATQMSIEHFFKEHYIEVRGMDRGIGNQSQRLSWETGLSAQDALHLATAMKHNVPELHTFDAKDLVPLTRKYGNPKIEIHEPSMPASPLQGHLDFSPSDEEPQLLSQNGDDE